RAHFDEVMVLRLLAHLRNLVESLASPRDEASWRLADLPLLFDAERHQVLAEWSDTATAWSAAGTCLHNLVAAQAARTPEAVAAVFEDESLTYRELEERANR